MTPAKTTAFDRRDILDMMGSLKLFGMRSAFDEVTLTAVKRQHETQRLVGDLLMAEIDEKHARSIKYQLTIAGLPRANDVVVRPGARRYDVRHRLVACQSRRSTTSTRLHATSQNTKGRHLIENAFCKIKSFRRIATRYDKTDRNYASTLNLAGSAIALR